MSFDFPQEITPEFKMTLERGQEHWSVTCLGILDAREAAGLVQPELMKLHEAALAAGVERIRLGVADVEYMNSSGLKAFMAWFLAAANARQGRYQIEVEYDAGVSWQHLSLQPMERLAPNTVRLVPRAASPQTPA